MQEASIIAEAMKRGFVNFTNTADVNKPQGQDQRLGYLKPT